MTHIYFEKSRKTEFWFMLITLVIVLFTGAVSAHYQLGWKSAWILSVGMYSILTGFSIIKKDIFIQKILIFSLAAGITELIADCWLVSVTKTLVYAQHEPMIACSPFYMPFSWAVILTQVGYIGWLVYKKYSFLITIVSTAIIGGMIIPVFEHWAKAAKWWYYTVDKMIYDTPYYIIFGEALLCAALPVCFFYTHKKSVWIAPVFGLMQGLWIWVSYFIFFKYFNS